MPIATNYPGVYIEEVASPVRTLVGVPTAKTAFVGRALRGPVNEPTEVNGFDEFSRVFGGLWSASTMSYAVQQFFLNGGGDAIIVRVARAANPNPAATAALPLAAPANNLRLQAASHGAWGNALRATVDHQTGDAADASLFNLTVRDTGTVPERTEEFRNVSLTPAHRRYLATVLEQESSLVRFDTTPPLPSGRPTEQADVAATPNSGRDGDTPGDGEVATGTAEANKAGVYSLLKMDVFNLLCIPPLERGGNTSQAVWDNALTFCHSRRAMLVVDPPTAWGDVDTARANASGFLSSPYKENAMLYFPHVRMADGLKENRLERFVPCGAVAGVIARTDATRGFWKAPAGQDATLGGVRELVLKLTDAENGKLNPLGVNCLRSFPDGRVVWGSRTMKGADRLASEWKYIPVRRTALYIEESLYRGTQWAVFEPNDEPLWSQIRLNVGAFMHNLFRQGAFQGASPREAYFVKCDKETTTQDDINRGVVNIHVGFAPLKPAEFVVIRISQMAGAAAAGA